MYFAQPIHFLGSDNEYLLAQVRQTQKDYKWTREQELQLNEDQQYGSILWNSIQSRGCCGLESANEWNSTRPVNFPANVYPSSCCAEPNCTVLEHPTTLLCDASQIYPIGCRQQLEDVTSFINKMTLTIAILEIILALAAIFVIKTKFAEESRSGDDYEFIEGENPSNLPPAYEHIAGNGGSNGYGSTNDHGWTAKPPYQDGGDLYPGYTMKPYDPTTIDHDSSHTIVVDDTTDGDYRKEDEFNKPIVDNDDIRDDHADDKNLHNDHANYGHESFDPSRNEHMYPVPARGINQHDIGHNGYGEPVVERPIRSHDLTSSNDNALSGNPHQHYRPHQNDNRFPDERTLPDIRNPDRLYPDGSTHIAEPGRPIDTQTWRDEPSVTIVPNFRPPHIAEPTEIVRMPNNKGGYHLPPDQIHRINDEKHHDDRKDYIGDHIEHERPTVLPDLIPNKVNTSPDLEHARSDHENDLPVNNTLHKHRKPHDLHPNGPTEVHEPVDTRTWRDEPKTGAVSGYPNNTRSPYNIARQPEIVQLPDQIERQHPHTHEHPMSDHNLILAKDSKHHDGQGLHDRLPEVNKLPQKHDIREPLLHPIDSARNVKPIDAARKRDEPATGTPMSHGPNVQPDQIPILPEVHHIPNLDRTHPDHHKMDMKKREHNRNNEHHPERPLGKFDVTNKDMPRPSRELNEPAIHNERPLGKLDVITKDRPVRELGKPGANNEHEHERSLGNPDITTKDITKHPREHGQSVHHIRPQGDENNEAKNLKPIDGRLNPEKPVTDSGALIPNVKPDQVAKQPEIERITNMPRNNKDSNAVPGKSGVNNKHTNETLPKERSGREHDKMGRDNRLPSGNNQANVSEPQPEKSTNVKETGHGRPIETKDPRVEPGKVMRVPGLKPDQSSKQPEAKLTPNLIRPVEKRDKNPNKSGTGLDRIVEQPVGKSNVTPTEDNPNSSDQHVASPITRPEITSPPNERPKTNASIRDKVTNPLPGKLPEQKGITKDRAEHEGDVSKDVTKFNPSNKPSSRDTPKTGNRDVDLPTGSTKSNPSGPTLKKPDLKDQKNIPSKVDPKGNDAIIPRIDGNNHREKRQAEQVPGNSQLEQDSAILRKPIDEVTKPRNKPTTIPSRRGIGSENVDSVPGKDKIVPKANLHPTENKGSKSSDDKRVPTNETDRSIDAPKNNVESDIRGNNPNISGNSTGNNVNGNQVNGVNPGPCNCRLVGQFSSATIIDGKVVQNGKELVYACKVHSK